MKKFGAILLAILFSFLTTSFTYADDTNDPSEIRTTLVSTEAEFISAASDTSAMILFNNVEEIKLSKSAQLLATVNLLSKQKLTLENGVILTMSGNSMIILAGGELEISPSAKIVATSNNSTLNVSSGGILNNKGRIEGDTIMTVYEGGKVKNASTGSIEWDVTVYGDDKTSIENSGSMDSDASFTQNVNVALDVYGVTEKEKMDFIHQLFTTNSPWSIDNGEPQVLEQLQNPSYFFYPDIPTLEGYKFAGWMVVTPQDKNKKLTETTKVCLEEFSGSTQDLQEYGIYGYYVKENDTTNLSGKCTTKYVISKETLINKYADIARYYGYDTQSIVNNDNQEKVMNVDDSFVLISKKNAIIIGCIACVLLIALACSLVITVKYVKGRNKVKSVNIYKKNK